jgi:hypothetical protein
MGKRSHHLAGRILERPTFRGLCHFEARRRSPDSFKLAGFLFDWRVADYARLRRCVIFDFGSVFVDMREEVFRYYFSVYAALGG